MDIVRLAVQSQRHALQFASAAHEQPWFAPFRQSLLIEGFAPMALRDYDVTLQWQQAALAAGYPEPA